jgi:osmotically-inducible protein OsmY
MNELDRQLFSQLTQALGRELALNPHQVTFSVEQGVVQLRGELGSYAEKQALSRAVRAVPGVRAVAEDLIVKVTPAHLHGDLEIAQLALAALASHPEVPATVSASVAGGWLTLAGTVSGHYQRTAAARSVRFLPGVIGVTNAIRIEPSPAPTDARLVPSETGKSPASASLEERDRRPCELRGN